MATRRTMMLSNNITQSNTGMGQAINSSTISSNASATAPATSSNSPSVNITAGLEKGQLIRGEVIDLRSNEVSVKLEDGRLLNGKLENSANLSIGENVTFRVEDVSLKNLTLKIVADAQYNLPDTTIDKALDAAGLSRNIRNHSIVQELLHQHMSIDKKMISNLIQQSITNKDVSVNTLVLMNKYHIPITETNINQFEAYRSGEHSILKEIGQLTNSISELFTQTGNTDAVTVSQGRDILNLILQDNAPLTSQNQNTDTLLLNSTERMGESQNALVTTGSLLSQQESSALVDLLKNLTNADSPDKLNNLSELNTSSELLNSIQDGTANLRDVAHVLQTLDHENSTITQSLLSAYEELQYNNNEIGVFLPDEERSNLLTSLKNFSLPQDITNLITSGDISSHDLLTHIQQKLGSVAEIDSKELFASKEYQTLIKEELTAKWSFTPDSLTKENPIQRHFESLSNELNDLMNYMEKATGSNNSAVSQQANQLQDNMDFMKTLNQMFTYVQLPLRLKNQNVHSELYVYTRKKAGRTAKDGISVLLHLDMEHLGPMDIHIDLHHKNVVSKFYLNHEDSIQLVSSHLSQLEEALQVKGYSLNTEIIKRTKEIDIVEDFMQQDTSIPSVTRYNFDIRA